MRLKQSAVHDTGIAMAIGTLILMTMLFCGVASASPQSGTSSSSYFEAGTGTYSTITLQPGPGFNDGTDDGCGSRGKDTWIRNAGSITGSDPMFYLWNISCNQYRGRGLLRFALDELPTQNVVSAKVHMFTSVYYNGSGWPWPAGNQQVSVRKVTSDWNETLVTWNTQPSFDSTQIDPQIVLTAGVNGMEFQGWLTFDITELYLGWINGSIPNYGMLFHLDTSVCQNGDEFTMLTSDWPGTSPGWPGIEGRPKLVVVYDTQPESYAIAASAGLGGTISPSGTVVVDYDGSQTFTITPSTNYHVADVLVDGTSVGAVTSYTFSNVTANHTITASFAINTFTITASAGAGGNIAPGFAGVNYGGTATFNIAAHPGYHVADVIVDGVSVGAALNYTFSNVTANHTIAASFAINTYTITATAGPNGSITPSGAVSLDYGASQGFAIAASTGYHVADVMVDGASVSAVTSYAFSNVTANHTISASFAINTYTITATAGPNGSITPSGAVSLDYGASQGFAIAASMGYHVADVLVDGASVGAVTSYAFSNVTANRTISASFAANEDGRYNLLRSMVNRCVTNKGIINSLTAKLDNAEAAEKRGNLSAKAGMIGAFINEVEAQTGKAIPKEYAAELIRLARLL